jgi:hypothetical protein
LKKRLPEDVVQPVAECVQHISKALEDSGVSLKDVKDPLGSLSSYLNPTKLASLIETVGSRVISVARILDALSTPGQTAALVAGHMAFASKAKRKEVFEDLQSSIHIFDEKLIDGGTRVRMFGRRLGHTIKMLGNQQDFYLALKEIIREFVSSTSAEATVEEKPLLAKVLRQMDITPQEVPSWRSFTTYARRVYQVEFQDIKTAVLDVLQPLSHAMVANGSKLKKPGIKRFVF